MSKQGLPDQDHVITTLHVNVHKEGSESGACAILDSMG